MTDEKSIRNRIIFLSFALTILVIRVHAFNIEIDGRLLTGVNFFSTGYYEIKANILSGAAGTDGTLFLLNAAAFENIFSELLGQIAVPGFFIISAYLFYRNIGERLTFEILKNKWIRRAKSLLLPYILWNLFYMLVHAAIKGGGPESFYGVFLSIVNYTYNPVFWYMKQLILFTVFSPFIYAALKKRTVGACFLIIAFFAAAFWYLVPFHIVNEDAMFYYMAGAYAALHLKNTVERTNVPGVWLKGGAALFAASAIGETGYFLLQRGEVSLPVVFEGYSYGIITGLSVLFRILSPLCLFCVISYIYIRKTERDSKESPEIKEQDANIRPAGFMNINFFIYATHYLVIKAVNFPVDIFFSGEARGVVLLAEFLFMPAVCISSAYAASVVLKRYVPGFWRIINGGR